MAPEYLVNNQNNHVTHNIANAAIDILQPSIYNLSIDR